MPEVNVAFKPWYHKWWGIFAVSVVIMAIISGVIFVVLTATYWRQIQRGDGWQLKQKFSDNFTLSGNPSRAAALKTDRARLEITDNPTLGAERASVVVVEFVDFKCPNSRRAAPIMRQVLGRFPGKIKLIVRNFPMETKYSGATQLAEMARCAHEQRQFWPVHDLFYAQQDTLPQSFTSNDLVSLAEQTGLNVQQFQTCLTDPAAARAVRQDYFDAAAFGVRGTPTFFINGQKVEGVIPFDVWEKILGAVK